MNDYGAFYSEARVYMCSINLNGRCFSRMGLNRETAGETGTRGDDVNSRGLSAIGGTVGCGGACSGSSGSGAVTEDDALSGTLVGEWWVRGSLTGIGDAGSPRETCTGGAGTGSCLCNGTELSPPTGCSATARNRALICLRMTRPSANSTR